jgi:nucleoside-diphosphate-sugar epimerase
MPAAAPNPGRVALTGASGFIGGHVVTALDAAGWRLRLLARRRPPILRCQQVPEVVIGDLADEAALHALTADCDAVLHLAGLVKAGSRAAFFRANAEGTERLARIAAQQPRQPRFILVSSIAAREPALSSYCASKRAGEAALRQQADGMGWSILRPPAIYGPRDRELLPFFRCIARGIAPRPNLPGMRMSMLFVKDLVDLLVMMLHDNSGLRECWEVDDGAPAGHSWAEIAAAAAGAIGAGKPRAISTPRSLLSLIGAWNEAAMALSGRPRMLTREKVRELFHADWVVHDRPPADGTKWQPRWDLTRGFSETAAWYRASGWL